ncbi:hypothetical protein O181_023315 [Austropuccinia psidii MF-1]|uniref:Uncharacterized protein n=1 Tax=Austropuccinia psidii MF-1 TaxID=1389203 RepID=A0A9Q3CIX3_9BASI|nr:hypothetical protein [Austropuccinia psidii MF-1]
MPIKKLSSEVHQIDFSRFCFYPAILSTTYSAWAVSSGFNSLNDLFGVTWTRAIQVFFSLWAICFYSATLTSMAFCFFKILSNSFWGHSKSPLNAREISCPIASSRSHNCFNIELQRFPSCSQSLHPAQPLSADFWQHKHHSKSQNLRNSNGSLVTLTDNQKVTTDK